MHPALSRLVDANTTLENARHAVALAEAEQRSAAARLSEIEDEEQRWDATVFAYRKFGKGLSLILAEVATGLPGKKGQSAFLVRAGTRVNQHKGRGALGEIYVHEPMTEWPAPDALEREVIAAHIAHGTPYRVNEQLGWINVRAELQPGEATAFLVDPTAAMADWSGLTRAEFVEWLSSEGFVRCSATTLKGTPCKSGIKGLGGMLPIQTWKEAKDRGGYCGAHGG